MDSLDTELLSSLFLLPDTIAIEALYPTKTRLTVQVTCMLKNATCPSASIPQNGFTAAMGEAWLMCLVVAAGSHSL
jgi:hypothetical protein